MTDTNNAIIQDGDKLNAQIKSLATRAAKLDKEFQVAVLSAVWHFGVRTNGAGELIGDVGYINRTYNALGKGARHVAMTAWLLQYGGVMANTGEDKKVAPFVKDKSKKVDLVGGVKQPWYTMKPSKKPDEVLDLLKLTLAVIEKASKAQEAGKNLEHAAMLGKLQAIAEEFASEGETADATGDAGATGGEAPAGQPDPLSL